MCLHVILILHLYLLLLEVIRHLNCEYNLCLPITRLLWLLCYKIIEVLNFNGCAYEKRIDNLKYPLGKFEEWQAIPSVTTKKKCLIRNIGVLSDLGLTQFMNENAKVNFIKSLARYVTDFGDINWISLNASSSNNLELGRWMLEYLYSSGPRKFDPGTTWSLEYHRADWP